MCIRIFKIFVICIHLAQAVLMTRRSLNLWCRKFLKIWSRNILSRYQFLRSRYKTTKPYTSLSFVFVPSKLILCVCVIITLRKIYHKTMHILSCYLLLLNIRLIEAKLSTTSLHTYIINRYIKSCVYLFDQIVASGVLFIGCARIKIENLIIMHTPQSNQ